MTGIVRIAWSALEHQGAHDHGWVAIRVHPLAPCGVRAALRMPDRALALLVDVSARVVRPGASLERTRGLDIDVQPLVPGPTGTVRLAISLAADTYSEVFEPLCEDVAAAVAAETSEQAAFDRFVTRLNAWQGCLARAGAGPLSSKRQLGLWGEVTLLKSALDDGIAPVAAVSSWTGPRGLHDFLLPSATIEVKTSVGHGPRLIHVSVLDQLDETKCTRLLLAVVRAAEDTALAETLPNLIDAVRLRLGSSGGARDEFDDGLIQSGYQDRHRNLYCRTLSCTGIGWFAVHGTFPRFRRQDVADGIVGAKYVVDMAACEPFEIAAPPWSALHMEPVG
jgi:hypothetical protein